ncbi:MAG TPA: CDP-alcohol phosphatidyltransferase family protein [Candidatus Saccharicenans sp.]|nr:CDP-alcohol phosphatidyltransferase family protein [Candidatus Saccharicenans sp.]HQO76227.1 CDP-alcohol phosphatidyltransferase family protein [Candidatus Saccharicenans sp.]HUM78858.1 CDP-alcohol phosphatidyltransferase family protein [Candidatus Saccharicenans sp.]
MPDNTIILLRPGSGQNILGLPLLLRAIIACRQAGLGTFYLIGSGSEEELRLVERVKKDRRVLPFSSDLHYFQAGSLSTEDKIKSQELYDWSGSFLLLDGEAIFDPLLLEDLNFFEPQEREIILFKSPADSIPDSTWSGLAVGSGKILPELLAGLLSIKEGENDLLRALPPTALVSYQIVPAGHFFLKVNSRQTEKEATRLLLNTARKPQDGFIAKHINRPISLFFSQRLLRLGASPSLLSFLNFLLGLVGAWLAAMGGGNWSFFLAGLCFELASIFDGCDGEVARLTYTTSDKGALSDVILDASSYVIFFSCLDLGLYRLRQDSSYLILMFIFLLSAVWYYYNLARYTRNSGIGKKIFLVAKEIEVRPEKEKKLSFIDKVAAKLAFTVRRDFFATLVFVLLALKQAPILAYIISFGWLAESVYFHFYVQKKLVEQSA